MKFNTTMPLKLKTYFDIEIQSYFLDCRNGNLLEAWSHLERAHVIGQAYPFEHTLVHWKMLKFGFRIKNIEEIIGQIPRLIVGGVKSFVGKIPVGNTGGANVPALKPMPIEEDIMRMFEKSLTSHS
mgnify:CR=1 FL=1